MLLNKTYLGTMLYEVKQPNIAKILEAAELDFFIIDCEHGMFTWDNVENIVSVANTINITPFVRVPEISRENISKALDCGAKGIILPYIKSADEVRLAVRLGRYPPLGERGVALTRGNTDFKPLNDYYQYTKWANENIVILAQIETNEGVENIEEIADIQGISGLFFGVRDLSIIKGIEKPYEDEYILNSFKKLLKVCRDKKILSGVHLSNLKTMKKWIQMGVNVASYSGEVPILINGYKEASSELKNILK